jgi:hypothetical protein
MKIVFNPPQQMGLVLHVHEKPRHFGVCHNHNLLQGQYWWQKIHMKVQQFMARGIRHDRVWASFNGPIPQLHPLPITGLGY